MESDTITTSKERWNRVRNLGHGAYGTVWKEQCVDGPEDSLGNIRAVKSTPKHHFVSWRRELNALMKFAQHRDHFVQIFGHDTDDSCLLIYMEFVPHGTLQNYITKHPLQEYEAIKVTTQLAQALQYMHAAKFIHRDLKPQNVLVNSPAPNWHVKVADFGISKDIAETSAAVSAADRGTWAFMAPEIMNGGPTRGKRLRYTPAVDIWALGATTHCIITKEPPFGGNLSDISDYARERITFKADSKALRRCSHVCVQFLSDTMKVNKDLRLTIDQVLEHEWLREDPSESDTSSMTSWDDGPTSPDAWEDTYYPEPTQHDSGLGSTQSTLTQPSPNASISTRQLSIDSAILNPGNNDGKNRQSSLSSNLKPISHDLSSPVTSIPPTAQATDTESLAAKDSVLFPGIPAALPATMLQHEDLSILQEAPPDEQQAERENVQSPSAIVAEEYNVTPDAADKTPDSSVQAPVCLELPSLVVTEETVDESKKTPQIISIDTIADEPDAENAPLISRRSTPYAIVRPRSLIGHEDLNEARVRLDEPNDEDRAVDTASKDDPHSSTLSPTQTIDTQELDTERQRGPMAWFKRKIRRSKSNINISSPRRGSGYWCDVCSDGIADLHFHCTICLKGDFDVCPECLSSGNRCRSDDHQLVRRSIREGKAFVCPDDDLGVDHHSTTQDPLQDDDFTEPQSSRMAAPDVINDIISDSKPYPLFDEELIEPHVVGEHAMKNDHDTGNKIEQSEPISQLSGQDASLGTEQSLRSVPHEHRESEPGSVPDQGSDDQPNSHGIDKQDTTVPTQGGSTQSTSLETVTDEPLQHGSPKVMDYVDHPNEADQYRPDPPPQLAGKFGLTIRRKPVNARSQTPGGERKLSNDTTTQYSSAQRTNSLPISPSSTVRDRAGSDTDTLPLVQVDDYPAPTESRHNGEADNQADSAHEDDLVDLGPDAPAEDAPGGEQCEHECLSMEEESSEPEDHYPEPYYELLRKRLRQAQDIARTRGDDTEEDEEVYESQTEDLEVLIEEYKAKLRATFQTTEAPSESKEQTSHTLHNLSELKRSLEEQVRELEEECVPDLREPRVERFAVLHTSHGDVVLAAQQFDGSERQENDEAFSRFLAAVETMMFSFKQLWMVNSEPDTIRDDKLQNPQYIKLNCETREGIVGSSFTTGEMRYAAVDIIEGEDVLKSLRDLAPGWSWTMRGNFKLSGGVIMQAEVVESGNAPSKKTYWTRGDPGSVREDVVQRKVVDRVGTQ